MAVIAVALDFPSLDRALALVDELGDEQDLYKVGLELFIRDGESALRELRRRGRRIFLDLKLHDIPNTVARAVEAAAGRGVEYLTVHASGGASMLRAASEAAEAAEGARADVGRVTLLGVTVLTSLDDTELGRAWGRTGADVGSEVARLGDLAVSCGLDGLVASAREVADLRNRFGDEVVLVTPGIRLAGGEAHDQARVATPGDAARDGADVLVVGRAVTAAADPGDALRRVRADMDGAG